jgi:hypothetical protein
VGDIPTREEVFGRLATKTLAATISLESVEGPPSTRPHNGLITKKPAGKRIGGTTTKRIIMATVGGSTAF